MSVNHAENARLHFGRRARLRDIRQSESTECGLACVAMIAGFHGHHVELATLRQRFPNSLKGMTLEQLMDVSQALGLAARALRLDTDDLGSLQTPSILHWDMDHFVVLSRVGRREIVVHDPANGIRRLTLAQFSEHFTGVALELSPSPQFKRKRAEPPISLRKLSGNVQGLGRSLVQIFSLALLLELLALIAPQFMQITVDQVLADGDHDLLALVGVAFIVLLLIQIGIGAVRTWVVTWLGSHFNLSWTGNVFQHLLSLPQSYFLKRHLGDIVSRFGAITTIQQTLSTQFVSVILDGLMSVLTLALLYAYSVLLASLTLAAVLVYAGLRVLYFRVLMEANLSQIVVSARQQSVFMEAVRGVQTIRLFGQSASQTSRYLNATTDSLNTSIAVQRLNIVFTALNSLTSGAQRVTVLWLGAWLGLKGGFSAGMLMAFVAYADQFSLRSTALVDYLIQLRLLRLQAERLADIVLTDPEPFVESRYTGPSPKPTIRFDNVSFRYGPGEPWIIRHCTFEIAPGDHVAITGPSGCGKSTLARLMLGLLDPDEGTISVDGVDLRHLGKASYRRMIGSVMQDDRLFAGSVAENIAFFDTSATLEDVERAARCAHFHEDLARMPMGYHTMVGDMGSSLSGGQQQRLLLARALYRHPEILVLDEATSHLDAVREHAIHDAIDQLSCTRILIAHRKETLDRASIVLIMEGGKLAPRVKPSPKEHGIFGFTAPGIRTESPALR